MNILVSIFTKKELFQEVSEMQTLSEIQEILVLISALLNADLFVDFEKNGT